MNRGRGRGAGGDRQWMVRGRSPGSGGRPSFQPDQDEPKNYTYNENPSGRGSSNQRKVEDLDQNSANDRHRNFGHVGSRGNSYRQGCSNIQVIAQDKRAQDGAFSAVSTDITGIDAPSLSDQARPDIDVSRIQIVGSRGNSYRQGWSNIQVIAQDKRAQDGACGSSRANVSSAVSTDSTCIDAPSLSDQARPDIDASKIQIVNSRGNSYRRGWSNIQVIAQDKRAQDGAYGSSRANVSSAVSTDSTGIDARSLSDQARPDIDVSKIQIVGSRGNSYRQGWSSIQVIAQDRSAQDGSCGSSRANVSYAVSTDSTGIDAPSLSDQARPDIDVSKIQIIDDPVKGVEKGKDLMKVSWRSMDVLNDEICQPSIPGIKTKPRGIENHVSEKLSIGNALGNKCVEPSDLNEGYDICFPKSATAVNLKPSLLELNREKRNEMKRGKEGRRREILGSGLVLLKNHLSISEQAQIVNICRRLGQGPGGFYQPGYQDGAKLWLKMMCLGKNWDPETNQYVDVRPTDGAKPPPLPFEFIQWVHRAIQESHQLIKEKENNIKVEQILPSMSPDLCIVNFYTEGGRLGLHRDRDESKESLEKGLPVVSFSIGDTAEFLYSDQGDVDKANKLLLESGDVLIFGGKSRHIFHGVERILPKTAPKPLLGETNLRQGRLNLTFRQY